VPGPERPDAKDVGNEAELLPRLAPDLPDVGADLLVRRDVEAGEPTDL
jgi:hypothetical protein